MTYYQYLIIGGGMTAAAAVSGIRQEDPEGSIGLISQESHPPYNRPPLSKGLWKGKPIEKIFRQTDQPGVDLRLSRPVAKVEMTEFLTKQAPAEIGDEKVCEISQRDGVKYIMSDDSWLLIRPSGTEPVLRVYAEGRTQEMVKALLGYGEQVAKSVV